MYYLIIKNFRNLPFQLAQTNVTILMKVVPNFSAT